MIDSRWNGLVVGVALSLALVACGGKQTIADPKQREEAARLNMQLAIDYYRRGDLQQAKEKLDRALEQDPRNANGHATAGFLYGQLGELDKAENHYERAISLDAKDPNIRNNYAAFLCKQGKHQRGEKQALVAIADPLYKTPEAALVNAGLCARGAADPKRAEQFFRRALAVQPRFAPALYEMAQIEFDAKNYLPARAFLERLVAAQAPGPATLWLGVRIELALNNQSMAGDYGRRLINEFPTSDETKSYLELSRPKPR